MHFIGLQRTRHASPLLFCVCVCDTRIHRRTRYRYSNDEWVKRITYSWYTGLLTHWIYSWFCTGSEWLRHPVCVCRRQAHVAFEYFFVHGFYTITVPLVGLHHPPAIYWAPHYRSMCKCAPCIDVRCSPISLARCQYGTMQHVHSCVYTIDANTRMHSSGNHSCDDMSIWQHWCFDIAYWVRFYD